MGKAIDILNIPNSLKDELDFWFRYNNISREKINLFHDFIISIDGLIDSTYIGPEFLYEDEAIKGHFNWCWNKTIENFEKERIFFKKTGDHYEYLWNFFYEAFYIKNISNEEVRIKDYYNRLFDLSHKKSETELTVLLTIYRIFDLNLKK